jgi:hypothetical protein
LCWFQIWDFSSCVHGFDLGPSFVLGGFPFRRVHLLAFTRELRPSPGSGSAFLFSPKVLRRRVLGFPELLATSRFSLRVSLGLVFLLPPVGTPPRAKARAVLSLRFSIWQQSTRDAAVLVLFFPKAARHQPCSRSRNRAAGGGFFLCCRVLVGSQQPPPGFPLPWISRSTLSCAAVFPFVSARGAPPVVQLLNLVRRARVGFWLEGARVDVPVFSSGVCCLAPSPGIRSSRDFSAQSSFERRPRFVTHFRFISAAAPIPSRILCRQETASRPLEFSEIFDLCSCSKVPRTKSHLGGSVQIFPSALWSSSSVVSRVCFSPPAAEHWSCFLRVDLVLLRKKNTTRSWLPVFSSTVLFQF